MAEEKETDQNSYKFPLNQRLLDESLKLKEERRVLKERLSKIEQNRPEVSGAVFEKVFGDYTNRLQSIDEQLLKKKEDIDRELATLYETRDKIQKNLKGHKDILEEIEFRHELGEFDKQEYQKRAKDEEDKIGRFEHVLTGVNTNIKRYEGLFEGEEDLFGEAPKEEPVEAKPEEAKIDEWEEEAREAQETTGEHTGNGQEWLEETKPNVENNLDPQVTIVSGKENVGKAFPIKNTVTIGRSHTNQVILKDAKVSRQHAEIKMQGSECILIDLNSSNGTEVNGQKVHEHILNPNDEIKIGDFVLQYRQ